MFQAYHYSIEHWLFLLYFYCIFGWIVECTYVSVRTHKLTNRGFMKGPWLPIYGFGAIIMLFCGGPFREHPILMFLAGTVGASVLEYITGAVMEALFTVRYWDYSYRKYNLHGYICLPNSLYWGLATMFLNYLLHNWVEGIVALISLRALRVIVWIISVTIAADFATAFKAAIDMRILLDQLSRAKDEMARYQKRLEVLMAVASDEVMDEVGEIKLKYAVLKDRVSNMIHVRDINLRLVIKGNPTMVSAKFADALDMVKGAVIHRVKNKELVENERIDG